MTRGSSGLLSFLSLTHGAPTREPLPQLLRDERHDGVDQLQPVVDAEVQARLSDTARLSYTGASLVVHQRQHGFGGRVPRDIRWDSEGEDRGGQQANAKSTVPCNAVRGLKGTGRKQRTTIVGRQESSDNTARL